MDSYEYYTDEKQERCEQHKKPHDLKEAEKDMRTYSQIRKKDK